jgi:hypothetical protein
MAGGTRTPILIMGDNCYTGLRLKVEAKEDEKQHISGEERKGP